MSEPHTLFESRDRWISRLFSFRGYTEDEARLAAWAGDEIKRLERVIRDHWSPEQADEIIGSGDTP